jgi:hypothetical protein
MIAKTHQVTRGHAGCQPPLAASATTRRHRRVLCRSCWCRTRTSYQATRRTELLAAGITAAEADTTLPLCARCHRRLVKDYAILAVFRDRFPDGGLLRDIAKVARTRPARVGAALGRLEGWGEITGRLGWDSARRCLRWNAAAAGPSEGGWRREVFHPHRSRQ